MNNLQNQLLEALYYLDVQYYRRPTKIKVTSDFANYLKAKCTYELINKQDDLPKGYTSYFTGIPVVIDDTIDDEYFKLIY